MIYKYLTNTSVDDSMCDLRWSSEENKKNIWSKFHFAKIKTNVNNKMPGTCRQLQKND